MAHSMRTAAPSYPGPTAHSPRGSERQRSCWATLCPPCHPTPTAPPTSPLSPRPPPPPPPAVKTARSHGPCRTVRCPRASTSTRTSQSLRLSSPRRTRRFRRRACGSSPQSRPSAVRSSRRCPRPSPTRLRFGTRFCRCPLSWCLRRWRRCSWKGQVEPARWRCITRRYRPSWPTTVLPQPLQWRRTFTPSRCHLYKAPSSEL
mmetsp:Transcript_14096/g.32861  ORF Transcript_14096/g.32861 Transcript_14096/m.32861 type:complete len:203 (+) Transcript_14096:716-1324(+)